MYKRLPAVIVLAACLLSFILVEQSQLLYGGYKGLLLTSFNNLFQEEVVEFSGMLSMNPGNDFITNGAAHESTLGFVLLGRLDFMKQEREINGYMKLGNQTMETPIFSYVKEDVNHFLIVNGMETSDRIELTNDWLTDDVINQVNQSIDAVYETMQIKTQVISDPRPGYNHLDIETTCYSTKLILDETNPFIEEIGLFMGEQSYEVQFLVSRQAKLLMMKLISEGEQPLTVDLVFE